jgi:hypothetical protein
VHESTEPASERWCRDLAQALVQKFGKLRHDRLKVFISHTTKGGDLAAVTAQVRRIVGETRLGEFFSTNALQIGDNWADQLLAHASTSAMLAVRTDHYATRPWCQREMLTAKRAGMPIVTLDVLDQGEERGSFLMDHVPRVPMRIREGGGWRDEDVRRGLNVLVDECLKRTLWEYQGSLLTDADGFGATWWAPHAPEPATFVDWLEVELGAGRLNADERIRIIHPDPPLGPDERAVLNQIARLSGISEDLDIVTPRMLASGRVV